MGTESCSVAAGYFKKALEDEGPQWAQHRKVLTTDGARGVRAFPKNFAYFYVQFGMTQGKSGWVSLTDCRNGSFN